MTEKRKQLIHDLLKKGIETGDAAAVAVVNPEQYIQHNPMTEEGGIGLAELFKQLAKTSPKVNIVRLFSDGDFVFGHTEYEFSQSRVGFEVFRFEGDMTVEHWDNIQSRRGPNPSNRSMVSGETRVEDVDLTETNRERVRDFVSQVLIARQFGGLADFVDENYIEHNPAMMDGLDALRKELLATDGEDSPLLQYLKLHRLLAEGNFVLAVSEGYKEGQHSAFYDLFRLHAGKIVEHWDTIETIPPRSAWKNDNGKF